MPYLFLKFLHVGSMFLATALAVGPSVVLYLIARSGDVGAIRRSFGFAPSVFRVAGALYGLGILFGVLAALNGTLDLTTHWLLTAYVLVGILIATNLVFDRWAQRVERSVDESGDEVSSELMVLIRARGPLYSLAAMVTLTLVIVFVMVVKPNILG